MKFLGAVSVPGTVIRLIPERNESEASITYFEYLELLGFVSHVGYEWFSKRPVSLDTPNHLAADILNEILKSVDCSSPDINQRIKNELLLRLPESEKNNVLNWM